MLREVREHQNSASPAIFENALLVLGLPYDNGSVRNAERPWQIRMVPLRKRAFDIYICLINHYESVPSMERSFRWAITASLSSALSLVPLRTAAAKHGVTSPAVTVQGDVEVEVDATSVACRRNMSNSLRKALADTGTWSCWKNRRCRK